MVIFTSSTWMTQLFHLVLKVFLQLYGDTLYHITYLPTFTNLQQLLSILLLLYFSWNFLRKLEAPLYFIENTTFGCIRQLLHRLSSLLWSITIIPHSKPVNLSKDSYSVPFRLPADPCRSTLTKSFSLWPEAVASFPGAHYWLTVFKIFKFS